MNTPPTTALIALTHQRGLLPLRPHVFPWAAALHDALVKASDDGPGRGPARCFSGRDDLGKPLENHHHAFLLPLALESDDAVDHFLIHAQMGFDHSARAALMRVNRLWVESSSPTLHVDLMALGLRDDFARRVPALGRSNTWTSFTPFVPPRHPKPRGRNTLEEQIQEELVLLGLPRAMRVEIETEDQGFQPAADMGVPGSSESPFVPAKQWRTFRLQRDAAAGKPPVHMAYGLRLTFDEMVSGPIAIGYGAHFGLGELIPA